MTTYKVYKMTNEDMPGLVYYGSTIRTLKERLSGHKCDNKRYGKNCNSKKLFETENFKIELLEEYDNELDMFTKERWCIKNNECLNSRLPCLRIKDYSKGKIYKITNEDMPDLVYYGSTIQPLNIRLGGHKSQKNTTGACNSKKLLQTKNAKIELVEDFPCETKRELEIREKWYILNFECINTYTPGLTKEENNEKQKEYVKNHPEQKKATQLKYRQTRKEQIQLKYKELYNTEKEKTRLKLKRAKDNIKYICDCGTELAKRSKARHERTIKHKNYLTTL